MEKWKSHNTTHVVLKKYINIFHSSQNFVGPRLDGSGLEPALTRSTILSLSIRKGARSYPLSHHVWDESSLNRILTTYVVCVQLLFIGSVRFHTLYVIFFFFKYFSIKRTPSHLIHVIYLRPHWNRVFAPVHGVFVQKKMRIRANFHRFHLPITALIL